MTMLSRRDFLKLSGGAALSAALVGAPLQWQALQPVNVDNPLAAYPDREWEQVYRDQYQYDSSFTFVCSPNDTHACRLRAFVRNGIILRCETNYDVERYSDLISTATGRRHTGIRAAARRPDLPSPHLRPAPAEGGR